MVKQFYLTHRLDLSDTTTLGPSGPRSKGNEGVVCIPQSSRVEASPSYGFVSYQDTQRRRACTPVQRCSQCILLLLDSLIAYCVVEFSNLTLFTNKPNILG